MKTKLYMLAKHGGYPFISLLFLLGLFVYQLGLEGRAVAQTDYHEDIAIAMSSLPKSYGGWIGQAVEVPQAASKLLHANEILSRSYRNLETGETAELVVVHCADARDLIGHYPPECYPAHGWVAGEQEVVELSSAFSAESVLRSASYVTPNGVDGELVGDVRIGWPCTSYRFERMSQGYTVQMVVVNYMVLPDGRIGSTMYVVDQAAADLSLRNRGAMQVQVIFRDEMMLGQRRIEIAEEFLDYLQPVFEAVWDEGSVDSE